MASTKKHLALKGSERKLMTGARLLGPAAPDERFEVSVRIRPRKELPTLAAMTQLCSGKSPPMTHAEYEAAHGANPADLAKIESFAGEYGLKVVESSIPRRTVILSGTASQFSSAFDVKLNHYEHAKGTYRGRTGPVNIPDDLQGIVVGVFGLDNRPVARPHFRRREETRATSAGPRPFNATDVAKLYNFPAGVNGSGQCIGIIELGGGYRPQDLKAYFTGLGLTTPQVRAVPVDGGGNHPGQDADDEVALDIEVAGAVAPGAKIAVYFAPNSASGQGFIDAVTQAIHDQQNNPSVLSISWGGPEGDPTDNYVTQFNEALQAAALLGVTVCVAAGDNGAADMTPKNGDTSWDGSVHVDFPASSPFSLACGGTRLLASSSGIESESVWNQNQATFPDGDPDGSFGSTGGGVSTTFPLPDYQQNANVPVSVDGGSTGRGVPDVAGVGDPATGFNIIVDGQSGVVGGTSAVAPLWAGLIALINQKLGRRVGFINPKIYQSGPGSGGFHDIVQGNNRVTFNGFNQVGYDAGPGWDPCTGLGSPDGTKVLAIL